jgi:hypothetical protein
MHLFSPMITWSGLAEIVDMQVGETFGSIVDCGCVREKKRKRVVLTSEHASSAMVVLPFGLCLLWKLRICLFSELQMAQRAAGMAVHIVPPSSSSELYEKYMGCDAWFV